MYVYMDLFCVMLGALRQLSTPPKKFYLMSKIEINKFSKNVSATSELLASADVIKEFSYQRHTILDRSVILTVICRCT